jgi:hypothetical protein
LSFAPTSRIPVHIEVYKTMTAKFVIARVLSITFLTGMTLSASIAGAQQGGVYAYPNAGQSVDMQKKDHADCSRWAVEQTGFDPARARAPQQQNAYYGGSSSSPQGGLFAYGSGDVGQGGMVADGARGAASGAMIGAIAGDAGKGAAIGAAAGALFGGVKRSNRKYEEQQWQQQQAQQAQQQYQAQMQQYRQAEFAYHRAYGACMSSRNYQVQ